MPEENKGQGGGGGQPQQQKSSGGGGGSSGGGGRRRKPMFDMTNIIGALIWLISAVFTALAISSLALPSRPAVCVGVDPNNLPAPCSDYLVRAIVVFVVSILVQVIISTGSTRLRIPGAVRTFNVINYAINVWGVYYVVVELAGLMQDVRAVVHQITLSTAISILLLVAIGIFLEWIANAFFSAPPSNPGGR